MVAESIMVERQGSRRLLVWLRGALEEDHVDELRAELLGPSIETGTTLLLDLTSLSGCSLPTRTRLMELQRELFAAGIRTAFVAQRPRFRGMCMWISHVAEDTVARTFPTREQAEMWLGETMGRLEYIYDFLGRKLRRNRGGDTRDTPSRRMRQLRKRSSSGGDSN